MSTPNESFAERMKNHQIWWAGENGIASLLERRKDGGPSWVLRDEHKTKNLKDASWWKYIEGKEHRWARSLLSSQCFAVNLFGPMKHNSTLAKEVFLNLITHRTLESDDTVNVSFEYTPTRGPKWLGETRQPTQIDVCFTIQRFNQFIGYLLIEVKFTESEFGSCRGAAESTPKKPGNPNPSWCLDLQSVIANPKERCWMADTKENGRRYWEYMLSPDAPFHFSTSAPCPFRHSLYQLMRNQVMASALVQEGSAIGLISGSVFILQIHWYGGFHPPLKAKPMPLRPLKIY